MGYFNSESLLRRVSKSGGRRDVCPANKIMNWRKVLICSTAKLLYFGFAHIVQLQKSQSLEKPKFSLYKSKYV